MTTLPEINRHWVGIPALALAIIGLGIVGNMAFKRPAESLSQISSAQTNQPAAAMNPKFISDHFLAELMRIPPNAFGSAQPGARSQNASSENQSRAATAPETKDWTDEEWRLASAAVTAYRKGGKQALSPTASADMIWQPPEEIANQEAAGSR